MENESAQQPAAPVAAPLGELSLADYRASRETAARDDAQPPAHSKEPAAAAGADDAPEAEATSETTQEQQEAKKKKLGGFQKTISRQSEEIAELKRQLAAGVTTPAAAKPAEAASVPAAAPEPVYAKPKPRLEDCDGIEEFTEKLADWKHDERVWKTQQKTEAAKRAEAVRTLAGNWKAKTAEFKASHDDYDAVLAGVEDVTLSPAHQQIFLESDHGVALAYELAQDRETLQKIAAMTPLQAAREIGKLEARYAAESSSADPAPNKEIKVSAAPRPIRPVSGSSPAAGTADPAKLSLGDYRKAREAGRIR
jgi:hypothetical protein